MFRSSLVPALAAAIVSGAVLTACGGSGDDKDATAYGVGRTSIEWLDSSRTERCGKQAGSATRRLKAYLWYPSDPQANARKSPLLTPEMASFLADTQGVSAAVLKSLPGESYADAPLSRRSTSYPVLLMSHGGGGGFPEQYASTAEALAAKGYVVVGLFHPYQSIATFFANGDIVTMDFACDPIGALPEIGATSSYQDFTANWQYTVRLDEYVSADFASALNQLDLLNSGSAKFGHRLELGRVGAFGHSFGGAHAFRAARHIPRVVAAANIDGTLFSEDYAQGAGAGKALLTVLSGDGMAGGNIAARVSQLQAMGMTQPQASAVANRGVPQTAYAASRPAHLLTVPGARHANFTDAGLWAAAGVPVDATAVNLADAREILNVQHQVLSDFFDRYLRGQAVRLGVPATSLKGIRLESRE
ncbi:alpha/beta hydrolase family protein [Sphaerotilus uruguayifluvii]|uniref:Dienelactone hydrolase n=1 Tax=Sphaerotilus uruguayifluvii TaxID=2735897 RepID=A0ABX2G9P9_9BURK|nr:hypothetical protein [Leptothrix sp. C29]NRT58224.1 dienelactone hydrolase [Leptothrix sp. C29]